MHLWLQLKFLSFEELQQRMSNLDSEMEREIYDLRRRYQAKRQPIQDAIDQKKKRQQNFWIPTSRHHHQANDRFFACNLVMCFVSRRRIRLTDRPPTADENRGGKHTKTWPNWGQVSIVTSHCRMPLCLNAYVHVSPCVSPCHNVQFFSFLNTTSLTIVTSLRNQGIFIIIANSFRCHRLRIFFSFNATVSHALQ